MPVLFPLLHALSQALLYPVLALLLLALLLVAFEAGVFLTEWRAHGRAAVPRRAPLLAEQALASGDSAREAERLIALEELALARRLERTDLLVRLGPALGLAGTLIPLGPGLAAMGRGEVQALAGALTIAFDTTVLGILIGGASFVLSSVRRRWYEGSMLRLTAEIEDRLDAARVPATERPG